METVPMKQQNCIRVLSKLLTQNELLMANLININDLKSLTDIHTIISTTYSNLLSLLPSQSNVRLLFKGFVTKPEENQAFFIREKSFHVIMNNKYLCDACIVNCRVETKVSFLDDVFYIVVNLNKFHDTLVKFY